MVTDEADTVTNPKKSQVASVANHKLNLNFFYKAILDKTNLKDVGNILFALMRTNLCRYSHASDQTKVEAKKSNGQHSLASKFVNMCCKSIKRLQEKNVTSENERCVPFFKILWNLSLIKYNVSMSNSAAAAASAATSSVIEANVEVIDTDDDAKQAASPHNVDCPNCAECQENKVDFTALILGQCFFLLSHSLSVCLLVPQIKMDQNKRKFFFLNRF